MTERNRLYGYIPDNEVKAPIEIREDLLPIVVRLNTVFPSEKVWDFFSSTPGETGGRIKFPYCRVDSEAINVRDSIYMLKKYKYDGDMFMEYYYRASLGALKAITWVEVGFEGLENLAASPASINWTSGVGHFVTDEQRRQGILTGGARIYNNFLHQFVQLRDDHKITEDDFTRYDLEHLLEKFRNSETTQ